MNRLYVACSNQLPARVDSFTKNTVDLFKELFIASEMTIIGWTCYLDWICYKSIGHANLTKINGLKLIIFIAPSRINLHYLWINETIFKMTDGYSKCAMKIVISYSNSSISLLLRDMSSSILFSLKLFYCSQIFWYFLLAYTFGMQWQNVTKFGCWWLL